MATYKLYDIGTVSDSTYMYKGVYRVGTQLSSVASYELMIFRFNLSDGSIDPNYGQQQQGAFRAHLQIKPNTFPVNLEKLCPGLMFDADNKLTFAGIAWMSGLSRHGFFIAKLDNTGNLSNYGSGNYGVSVGGFDTNIYSCTKELLVDKSNNCIFGVSTREHSTDIASPSYISRRDNVGNTDNNFGNNGKVEITDSNFTPQITSLTFDNYGNYYVGYNSLKQDGSVFGNSYIKSYNYSGSENTYFSTNGKVLVDAGANFAAEAPQDLGSIIRDQYLNYVKVFLTMNSVNNATSLTDPVGSHNISFVGNAKISTDNKKFGSSSLRLDGTNNSYLQIGTNNNPSDIPLNNEDFCIEMMLYLDAVDDGRRILSLGGNDSTNGLLIESLNSGDNLNSLRVMMGNAGNNSNVVNLVGKYCLVEKQWQHIAYVRQDNNVYLYVDGELKAAAHYEGSVNLGTSGSLKLGADQSGENGMIGNIDDFRLTIGKSRYFNTFKIPEHQISNVGKSSDVKLLLHFEGDNNSKTIVDRGHSIMTNISALGNAEISSDKNKFGGTSLKLDGTNSVVEVPDSKIIWPSTFYSNPFTIEGYFNFSDVSKTQVMIKKNNSITMQYDNLGGLKFLSVTLTDTNNATTRFKQLPWEPVVNRWYHIAFVKNGSNVSLYVDGQRLVNANYLNTLQDGGSSNSPWDIGGNRAGNSDYFNGYIDEIRIVASAVYNDTFTPAHHQFFPTQEHVITSNDNYANQVELLLHFEEANGSNLVDSSKSDYTVTLNQDGVLDSTTSRFGNNSLSVPRLSGNSSSYGAKVNSNGSLNLTGNYTIETYFKLNSDVTEERVILEIRSDDNLSNSNPSGGFKIRLQQYTDPGSEPINVVYMGSGDLLPIRGANLYTKDTWYHIAVVRENSDVSCYLNGSLLLKKTFASNIPLDVYGNVYLGGAGNGSLALDGVIDEVRITNGIARYTANFTPQNSAFGSEPVAAPEPQYIAADYSNSRLLLHFDSVSTNAISSPEDSSGNNVSCNVVVIGDRRDAGRTSNLSKFGGKSWNMNANSNANYNNHLELTCDDSNLVLGTGDFTIELWIYKTSMENRHQTVLAMGINNEEPVYGGMPFAIYINDANQGGEVVASLVTSTGGNPSWRGPDFTPYLNQWVHLAFVRHNGVATFYLNGTSVDSKSNNANLTTSKLFIGGHNPTTDASRFFRGYIDELHIRDIAAYTQNFTPPNHAFGKQLQNVVQASAYYGGRSELAYMLPLTQTSSFLAVAKKTNSDSTTYAEVLNIKHDGKILETWGDYGKIALTAPGYSYSNPETMWMDRELNLYVGGCAQKISNGLKDGVVWKITSDGALDTTFGTSGVDIIDNTTLDETITSMYNDYDNNKMIFTSLFTGDSGATTNVPIMAFDNYNFGGNLTFLSSYDYITKETTPAEGLNRVLQDMGLVNAAHIKMPASMFNNLLGTYNETTNKFPVSDIILNVDQAANDNITVVSGGLIKDFWNYFIAKIETIIPANKRNLWDDSPSGANGYTNAKLQTFFRDIGLGTLTVPNVNDVIREYEANASSLFPYRAGIHRRQGFVAGDKAGINAGVQITFQTTISAATGGTASDTIISETRTFNVLLELE